MPDEPKESDPEFVKIWLRLGVPREKIEAIAAEILRKEFSSEDLPEGFRGS